MSSHDGEILFDRWVGSYILVVGTLDPCLVECIVECIEASTSSVEGVEMVNIECSTS
jgi:hypothetical protein